MEPEEIVDGEIEKNKKTTHKTTWLTGSVIPIISYLINNIILNFLPNITSQTRTLYLIRSTFGLIILIVFLAFEYYSTGDVLGIQSFKNSEKKPWIIYFFKAIFFLYIAVTFIAAPFPWENISRINDEINKTSVPPQTNETVLTKHPLTSPTVILIDPSETSVAPTNTLVTPTFTPIITPTSQLAKYRVGVIAQNENCGEKDKNDQIIKGLNALGFTVFEVEIDDDYSNVDVLYMPYGWSCTGNDYDLKGVREFLDRSGTGLLIGNPAPEDVYSLKLFQFELVFSPLTEEEISIQNTPSFPNPIAENLYKDIFFKNIAREQYPIAEAHLSTIIENVDGKYSYRYLLFHQGPYRPSFIVSNDHNHRFVIMPGSELSVSEHAVPENVMRDIIKWLAHAPLNN